MKNFLYSLIIFATFTFYAIYQNRLSPQSGESAIIAIVPPSAPAPSPAAPISTTNSQTPSQPLPPPKPTPAPAPQSTPTPAPVSSPPPTLTPIPTPPPQPKGLYIDGQYTGSTADAYYGNVQVQVTVSGGKISGVTFLQYPKDRSTSRYINSQAMPYLKTEAIQAQSANVDIISGATDTSMAFQQSLASALARAKA